MRRRRLVLSLMLLQQTAAAWTTFSGRKQERQRIILLPRYSCCPEECCSFEQQQQQQQQELMKEATFGNSHRRRQLLLSSAAWVGSSQLDHPSCWARTPKESSIIAQQQQQQGGNSIPIPFSSVRRYKTLTLSNGLRVILASDKRATYRAQVAVNVGGAGQFADSSVTGLAHLMEHIILSGTPDLEDWLSDRDGASNGFTAYHQTCFYLSCPPPIVPEALARMANLLSSKTVYATLNQTSIIAREVRRVDSELDFGTVATQAYYLTKQFVNVEHPYRKFSAGSMETLYRPGTLSLPDLLRQYFEYYYRPDRTVLTVVSNQELGTLERLAVTLFSNVLSSQSSQSNTVRRTYPGGFVSGNRYKHIVLYRPTKPSAPSSNNNNNNNNAECLIMQWTLSLSHEDNRDATEVAFCLAQILGRKGPGSFYQYLLRRGWIASGGIPKFSVPVNVPQFQLLKLELALTQEGVLQRSSVLSAVYDTLETLRTQRGTLGVRKEIVAQCAAVAKLQGYWSSPRPPDAIELAVDAQRYGIENGVGSGIWYQFAEDRNEIAALQRDLAQVLTQMVDPDAAVVIFTASNAVIARSGLLDDSVPPLDSPRWKTEPVAGGKFLYEDMLTTPSRIETSILRTVVANDELVPPVVNPFIPVKLLQSSAEQESPVQSPSVNAYELIVARGSSFSATTTSGPVTLDAAGRWLILEPTGRADGLGLVLPRGPPEPSIGRCAFVLQLLSPRPARAGITASAEAQLFAQSWHKAVIDLVELGAPGGLAYDLSFNKFGVRLAVLGIREKLPSYTRRLVRRLVQHPYDLLRGPEHFRPAVMDFAVASAARMPTSASQLRKRSVLNAMKTATTYNAAAEGIAFLRSCNRAVCFAQGDFSFAEQVELLQDLREILGSSLGMKGPSSATPTIADLLYKTYWKPAGICTLPGVQLVSNACSRVPR